MEVFVEIIGYVGMAIILCSSLMTTVKWIRIVNICGSILCATYGILTVTIPTVALNVGLMLINISFLIVLIKKEKRNKNNNTIENGEITDKQQENNAKIEVSLDVNEHKGEIEGGKIGNSAEIQNTTKKPKSKNKIEKIQQNKIN